MTDFQFDSEFYTAFQNLSYRHEYQAATIQYHWCYHSMVSGLQRSSNRLAQQLLSTFHPHKGQRRSVVSQQKRVNRILMCLELLRIATDEN